MIGCRSRFDATLLGLGAVVAFVSLGSAWLRVSRVQAAPTGSQRVAFACPGGLTLAVEFATMDPQAPAIVHPPNGPAIALPAKPSGDGFRYADASHELRGRGRDVTWTVGSMPPLTCQAP
ncbi:MULTISPECIES: hypothetical protein [unclassified Methylobacterium]|uniref:hypothetical protein n=1 Tax=unclassified Methylobacterium TaxID=2615210 RepID=UPI0036F930BD